MEERASRGREESFTRLRIFFSAEITLLFHQVRLERSFKTTTSQSLALRDIMIRKVKFYFILSQQWLLILSFDHYSLWSTTFLRRTVRIAIKARMRIIMGIMIMNQLHTWFPWFRGVTTKDVFSTFDQHQSRTFVITAAMKVSRRVTISWSAVQQRTCRIRRQPWLKSWLVGFILYYQRGAEKTTRHRCFVFQLLNDTLDLIKLSFLKQSFMKCSVLREEKLTVAEVVQNVPSSKTMTRRHEF